MIEKQSNESHELGALKTAVEEAILSEPHKAELAALIDKETRPKLNFTVSMEDGKLVLETDLEERTEEFLRKEREFFLEELDDNWGGSEVFKYIANRSLFKDRDFMLEAIAKDPYAVEFADESTNIRNDRRIMLDLINSNPFILEFADESIKKDPEVVLGFVTYWDQHYKALEHAHESLKKDPGFMLKAMRRYHKALEYAHESLKKDPGFMLEAIQCNYIAFEYADESLRRDPQFIAEAIAVNPKVSKFFDESEA